MLQMAMRSLLCACRVCVSRVSRVGGEVWGLIEMGILQSSHFSSVTMECYFSFDFAHLKHPMDQNTLKKTRSYTTHKIAFLVYVRRDGCVSCNAARLVALELSNMIVDPARIYHVGAGNCVA